MQAPPLWFRNDGLSVQSRKSKVTDFEGLDCRQYSTQEQALEGTKSWSKVGGKSKATSSEIKRSTLADLEDHLGGEAPRLGDIGPRLRSPGDGPPA